MNRNAPFARAFALACVLLALATALQGARFARAQERRTSEETPTFVCPGDRCPNPGVELPKDRNLECGCDEHFCGWACLERWHKARSRWHCARCGIEILAEVVDSQTGVRRPPGAPPAPERWSFEFCSDACKARGRIANPFRPKPKPAPVAKPVLPPGPAGSLPGAPAAPPAPRDLTTRRGDERAGDPDASPFRAAKLWNLLWMGGLAVFCVFMIRRRQAESLLAPTAREDGKRVLVDLGRSKLDPTRPQAPARPKVDPALGDRDALRLRAELAGGSWQAASRFLDATRDPHEREFYVEALSDWPGRPRFLDEWVTARPRSSSARLLRGRHSIHWAWEARGTGLGATVTAAGSRAFLARLELAEADLREAAALDPADPTPHALLLITARGLELSEEEARARFRAATERFPESMGAHTALLSKLCMKWGGSHEKMFELARSASAGAREESPLHALVPRALIEYWLMAGDDRARFLDDPKNREELILAYRRWRGSRTGTESKRDVFDLNFFCFGFALLGGPPEDAIGAFARLGDRATEWPWKYFGDPLAELRSARARFAPKASSAGAPPGSAA